MKQKLPLMTFGLNTSRSLSSAYSLDILNWISKRWLIFKKFILCDILFKIHNIEIGSLDTFFGVARNQQISIYWDTYARLNGTECCAGKSEREEAT